MVKSVKIKNDSFKIGIATVLVLMGLVWFLAKDAAKTPPPSGTWAILACSLERSPVCGQDGKTYSNACTAEETYNIPVAYDGECTISGWSGMEISPSVVTDTGTSAITVDSGIENLEQIPKYSTDRENTGTTMPSSPVLPESISTWSGVVQFESGQTQSGQTLISYTNTTYHYGFSMPKNSYYAAFGAKNGANHSVGISTTGSGVESLDTSDVRVYFFANKIVEKLVGVPNGFYTDPTTGTIYMLLGANNSVVIESNNPESETIKTIVRTIHMKQ